MVISLILLPFAGVISDLGNKRKTIIIGEWLFASVIIGLFVYTQLVEVSLVAIYFTTLFMTILQKRNSARILMFRFQRYFSVFQDFC